MILPVRIYGDPVLRAKSVELSENNSELGALIGNLYDTMDNADGVGLAAPQVGVLSRIFVVNGAPLAESKKMAELKDFRRVFINPVIIEESTKDWVCNEGCLSIPGIREDVKRMDEIVVDFFDETFTKQRIRFSGMKARIIQHETDHLNGVLFIDKLSPLKRRLLKRRLSEITKGLAKTDYPVYKLRIKV